MKRSLLCLGLCLLACAVPAPSEVPAQQESAPAGEDAQSQTSPDSASPLWVVSEVRFPNPFSSLFYAFYTGEPVQYRLLVHNLGEEALEAPESRDVRAGLRVTGEKNGSLSVKTDGKLPGSELPSQLQPGQVVGAVYNLLDLVPDLTKPDVYTIDWGTGDWKSNTVKIRTIPRFNPEVDYEAVLETEEGQIRIELLSTEAPIHVRNFVNLSRLGYYDNQTFHTSARDRSIRTGSPRQDGLSSIGYQLPAEISSIHHVPGTVSMYRDLGRPGSDSDGSQFFISLVELPNRDGKFTVFGRIKEGLSVAKKIGSREPSADPSQPPGSPKTPAKIHKVLIVETPRAASSEG